MTNENLRMQMLSGIITEGEYKAKLEEKASLNESMIGGIVGVGAINQIPPRAKADYEMAFEHFLGERYLKNFDNPNQDLEEGEDGKHLYGNKYVTSAGGKVEKNTTPSSRQDMEAANDMARNLGLDPDAYSSILDKYDGYGPNMESELEEENSPGAHKSNLIKLIATGERQLADLKQMKDKISSSSITKAEKAIEMLKDALKDTNK